MNPDVTVIIPSFNAAAWLANSIASASAQQEVSVEILVVDDGSTDASRTIAESFSSSGVRLFTQTHRGASAARNRGLAEAKGDWIQFLDADDMLSPGKLSAQCARLRTSSPQTVASCAWGRFDDGQSHATSRLVDTSVFRDFSPAWTFLRQQAATGCMVHPAAWLASRQLLQTVGPWDESLSVNDDGEYFARVLSRATQISFVSSVQTYYRSGVRGSLSQLRSPQGLASLHRSAISTAHELLRCDRSPETNASVAEMWERIRFELYPEASDLSDDAARRARAGGYRPVTRLPCGPKLKWLRALGAWKTARSLQVRYRKS